MIYQPISCSGYQERYERQFENGQEKLVLSALFAHLTDGNEMSVISNDCNNQVTNDTTRIISTTLLTLYILFNYTLINYLPLFKIEPVP